MDAFRAAHAKLKCGRLLVVGSQSILGSHSEDRLPTIVTMSVEFDMALLDDSESGLVADVLDGEFGEMSEFHRQHGWHIQGVSPKTAKLPLDWETRAVIVEVEGVGKSSVSMCLEPHDLCASKLARNEERDRRYVAALVHAGLVSARLVRARLDVIPLDEEFTADRRRASIKWIKSLQGQRAAVADDASVRVSDSAPRRRERQEQHDGTGTDGPAARSL